MGTWVVTGANRGIGLELARQISTRGTPVVATCRNPEDAGELCALKKVEVRRLDVADDASVRAFAKEMVGTPVDVLINNAGIGGGAAPLAELDFEKMKPFFDVNALGPLRVARALLANLRTGTKKTIVNISSRFGSIDDNTDGGWFAYRASKAALNQLNRTLSLELAPEGFTCVVLHPGWVQTRIGGPQAPVSPEESVNKMLRVLGNLSQGDTGQFLSYTGDQLPW